MYKPKVKWVWKIKAAGYIQGTMVSTQCSYRSHYEKKHTCNIVTNDTEFARSQMQVEKLKSASAQKNAQCLVIVKKNEYEVIWW